MSLNDRREFAIGIPPKERTIKCRIQKLENHNKLNDSLKSAWSLYLCVNKKLKFLGRTTKLSNDRCPARNKHWE